MRTSLGKVQYLLYALLLLALTGCGVNDKSVGTDLTGNGQITAKLAWPDGKTTGKSVALLADVTTVQLVVSGSGIPTAKGVPAAKGTNPSVEVYPGSNLTVAAYALKADGTTLYEGFVTGVTVTSGGTTDVGTIQLTPPILKTADAACVGCHELTRTINGQNLITDYKQSGHYTNTSWLTNTKNGSALPGCAGCHGTKHNDTTPSASGRCFECHGANLSLRHTDVKALVAGDANLARYLNLAGTNCSACHEPHNPINGAGYQERKDWAKSLHGNIDGLAWKHYDFTTRDTCNSCHTSAGFAKAAANNFTDKKALSTTTLGKQPLTCDGCHSSNDFKNSVRTLTAPFVAPFTPSLGASATFPGSAVIGNSQICVPCHAGLNSGKLVESATFKNLTGSNFGSYNSHYMAAAGVMYVKSGFAAFTSAGTVIGTSTYGKSLTATDDGGAVSSTHRILGTPAMATDSHVGGRALITGGPCITCHMKGGHSFAINGAAYDRVCVNCHTKEGTTALTATNFRAVFITPQAEVFEDALNLALTILKTKYGISYNEAVYPYFYDLTKDPSGATAIKDWTRGHTLSFSDAKKLLGACFNINILKREPAAYAHARTYTRRLVYDTIDWLDDNQLNMSASATAVAKSPAVYQKGATAYTDGTLQYLTTGTSESMTFLNAWSRTTGAWSALERP